MGLARSEGEAGQLGWRGAEEVARLGLALRPTRLAKGAGEEAERGRLELGLGALALGKQAGGRWIWPGSEEVAHSGAGDLGLEAQEAGPRGAGPSRGRGRAGLVRRPTRRGSSPSIPIGSGRQGGGARW